MTTDTLIKRRSIAACLSDAFDSLIKDFSTILRKTWPFLLATTLLNSLIILTISPLITGGVMSMKSCVVFGILLVVSIPTLLVTLAKVFNTIFDTPFHQAFKRTTISLGLYLILYVIVYLCCFFFSYFASRLMLSKGMELQQVLVIVLSIGIALALIFSILSLPAVYIFIKYIVGSTILRNFKRDYLVGLRHLAFLLGVVLLSGLIVGAIDTVLSIPFQVIIRAGTAANIGVALGDPIDIPNYFQLLIFGSILLVGVLSIPVFLWELFTLSNAYGSIEAREAEKKEKGSIR